MWPKMFFIKNLLLVLEMAVLECLVKHSQKPLGVKCCVALQGLK